MLSTNFMRAVVQCPDGVLADHAACCLCARLRHLAPVTRCLLSAPQEPGPYQLMPRPLRPASCGIAKVSLVATVESWRWRMLSHARVGPKRLHCDEGEGCGG